jgi:hypothetical protein
MNHDIFWVQGATARPQSARRPRDASAGRLFSVV